MKNPHFLRSIALLLGVLLFSCAHKGAPDQELIEAKGRDFTTLSRSRAVDVAEPCMEALLAQPTVANGWQLSEASCSGRAVSVTWAHQSQADFLSLPDQAALKSPQLAVSRLTLATDRKARTGQNYPAILTRESAARHLYQITQQAGARLRLTFQKP
ncbi:hypothetical protein, partial [Desulfovibrio sp. ZJ200]|uniref:hypothetical protein n=1 Tax=Desulfovibrio sp. ZJ200 TaxID=2709792 RepID=UPI0013EA98DE